MIALKAVSYFEDINYNLDKPKIWRRITSPQLKKRIFQAVQYIDRVFIASE